MDIKKATTYAASGQGPLTVGQLVVVLQNIPDQVDVSVTQSESQYEGSWWRVEAELQE